MVRALYSLPLQLSFASLAIRRRVPEWLFDPNSLARSADQELNMTDEMQMNLEMYKVQVARSQHYEGLRATLTNVILGVSAAVVALATFDKDLSKSDAFLGAAVILLGLFGYVASRAHSTRSQRHGDRAAAYRDKLDSLIASAAINETRDSVPGRPTNLDQLWSLVHVGVSLIGLALTCFALRGLVG